MRRMLRCKVRIPAHHVDRFPTGQLLPHLPMRQWVLSFPFQFRFLFASWPEIMSRVLGIVYRLIEIHLIQQVGCTPANAKTGAVTLVQRFVVP